MLLISSLYKSSFRLDTGASKSIKILTGVFFPAPSLRFSSAAFYVHDHQCISSRYIATAFAGVSENTLFSQVRPSRASRFRGPLESGMSPKLDCWNFDMFDASMDPILHCRRWFVQFLHLTPSSTTPDDATLDNPLQP